METADVGVADYEQSIQGDIFIRSVITIMWCDRYFCLTGRNYDERVDLVTFTSLSILCYIQLLVF